MGIEFYVDSNMAVSWSWAVAAFILTLGCAIQTAVGFGMAVIAAPIIMLVKPEWVPYTLTSTALLLSLINAWHQRAYLNFSMILPAVISRIPGTVVGAWLLVSISLAWLHLVVAICVLAGVLVSLSNVRFDATPSRMSVAGFFSGFMGTTTSIGGPPMALVLQHADPKTVRANLGFYFAYACVISMLSYAIAGLLTREVLIACVSFFPSAILGFLLGKGLHAWVDKKHFRKIILLLCGIASLIALIGAVSAFI
ncbi:MAG: sulfite exporter TauE/SafE family protein [Agarilytica sp.]